MSGTLNFTDTLPDDLPDSAALIEKLRGLGTDAERQAVLAEYPALELAAPIPVLARWLNVKESSIYMARTRTRPDGSPVWPDTERKVLGRKVWTFAEIALNRATAPGRGWNLRGEVRQGAK